MAAITMIDMAGQFHKLCEIIAITNQTANSTAVTKGIAVPSTANYCTIVINDLTMGGTSPLFDFTVQAVDVAAGGYPADTDDLVLLGGWDGITQKTAASATNTTIDIGPIIAADDSGSATASDRYGVQAVLPAVLAYTYTTDGTTDDEDYSGTISIYFRR